MGFVLYLEFPLPVLFPIYILTSPQGTQTACIMGPSMFPHNRTTEQDLLFKIKTDCLSVCLLSMPWLLSPVAPPTLRQGLSMQFRPGIHYVDQACLSFSFIKDTAQRSLISIFTKLDYGFVCNVYLPT